MTRRTRHRGGSVNESTTLMGAGVDEKDEALWAGVDDEYMCRRAGRQEGQGDGCWATRRTTCRGPGNKEDDALGVDDNEDEAMLAPICVAPLGS